MKYKLRLFSTLLLQPKPRKAMCPHCGVNRCTRAGPCFSENGQDLHPHSCLDCHRAHKAQYQGKGQKGGGRGGDR